MKYKVHNPILILFSCFCFLLITANVFAQKEDSRTSSIPSIQDESSGDFSEDKQYFMLKVFKTMNWYLTANTSVLASQQGIQDIPLSRGDSSPLLQTGWGWKTYLGGVVFNQDFSMGTWQLNAVSESKNKIAPFSLFVNLGLGYTVFQHNSLRIAPVLTYGFGFLKLQESSGNHLYQYVGGDVDISYSLPIGSATMSDISKQRNIQTLFVGFISCRVGYAQNFSRDPFSYGMPTHNSFAARLIFGIGTETFFTSQFGN